LFDVAKVYGMEITELVSSVPVDANLEGLSFSLSSLEVCAEGELSKMVDFIVRLNACFGTGVIQTVNIAVPSNPTSGNATVEISMDIYTN
jgi:hypothetical protein